MNRHLNPSTDLSLDLSYGRSTTRLTGYDPVVESKFGGELCLIRPNMSVCAKGDVTNTTGKPNKTFWGVKVKLNP